MGAKETKQLRRDFEDLKRNDPTLRSLDYEDIQIGNEGASALAKSLRNNTNLRRLKLGHCNVDSEGLHHVVRALCENRLVPSRLRKLELSTSSAPTPQGNPIGDEGAKSLALLLASSTSLHHLRVSACGIGDDGAVSIAKVLAQNKMLKTLDLSYNSISDIGAEELGSALESNSTLKGLLLWNNRVFHTGAEALANGLASNSALQWLGLGCNHIGDEGVKALALALLSNMQASGLIWLALGGNRITDKGAEHLAIALKVQRTPNPMTSRLTEEQAETSSLTEQIRHGKLRPMLDLGVTPSQVSMHVGGKEEEEEEEKEASVSCIPLQSLGLGGNKITCLGAGYLAQALQTNTNLLSLGLADNCISNEGASSLAELIRQTDTLEKITLSGNDIYDEGGSMLMAALSQNTSLQGLYLAGNPCGDMVSERCREVVGRHNHTLRVLDLHDTRMTTPAVSELLDTMRSEKVLRSLGSQPLPLPGAKGHAPIPLSGNMLEMEKWVPQSFHTIMLQKKDKQFTSTAPSLRFNTLDALESLPAPKETAQTMVVRQSQQAAKGTRRRRGSISQYIKRKLSRSKDGAVANYETLSNDGTPVASKTQKRKATKSPLPPGGIELQPLVEEGDVVDGGGGAFVESRMDEVDVPHDVFRTPTMVVENEEGDGRDEEDSPKQSTLASSSENPAVLMHDPVSVTSTPSPTISSVQAPLGARSITSSSQAVTSSSVHTPQITSSVPATNIATSQKSSSAHAPQSVFSITSSSAPASKKPKASTPSSAPASKKVPTTSSSLASVPKKVPTTTSAPPLSSTTSSTPVPAANPPAPAPVITTSSALTSQNDATSLAFTGGGGGGGGSAAVSSTTVSIGTDKTTSSIISSGIKDGIDLDAIPRTISLDSMTRDRPKPPSHRRPPSRFRTPSPSPASSPVHAGSSGKTAAKQTVNKVERIGGITDTVHEGGDQKSNGSNGKAKPQSRSPHSIKDQWSTALQKRVGVLKMGGFLHRGFEAITSAEIGKDHNFTAGRMHCNDHKNRLVAPLPPSHTRVKLQLVPDELGSDYINANYVGPSSSPKQFIVSQAPIPSTSGDFWRMIWEQRVGVIIILTKEDEVDAWWPEEGESHSYSLVVDRQRQDNSLIVSSTGEQVNSANPHLIVYTLTLESLADNDTDTVKLFHYTNWAQYGTVESVRDISGLVRHVLRAKFSQQYAKSPVTVVSKLGTGRAGCFCAICLAYELMSSTGEPQIPEEWNQDVNILDQIIRGLRECRGGLVSSQKQFEFCHQALEEVMWGRPASQEELDTWERLTRNKGKKGKKKWKVFTKKEKTKDKKQKGRKIETATNQEYDTNTSLLF